MGRSARASRWLPAGLTLLALVVVGLGCQPTREPLRLPSARVWSEHRASLDAMRSVAQPAEERTLHVAVSLREPYTGTVHESRGAVAISPKRDALRMILLGPGGTTALDLWVRGDAYRFEVPALDLLRRGSVSAGGPELRGLPVRFLRWWLLEPLGGRLLWAERGAHRTAFILRTSDATVRAEAAEGSFFATRRTFEPTPEGLRTIDVERVSASGLGCTSARYVQSSTGLEVTVQCERVQQDPPPPDRAFDDPDAPEEAS